MNHPTPVRRPGRGMLIALLIGVLAAGGLAAPAAARPEPGQPRTYRTANGITLEVGSPLPIFRMSPPPVSADGSVKLSQLFSSIYARQSALPDSYRGQPRYTVPATGTNSILEQYGATGGFYAYNAQEAFGETVQGVLTSDQAAVRACTFLLGRQFINADGQLMIGHDTGQIRSQLNGLSVPPPGTCAKPPYSVAPIWADSFDQAAAAAGTPQLIGAVVEVPMTIYAGAFSQNPVTVPLGGAGGHISLLFRPTIPNQAAATFSLDSSVEGLAAIAMPFYDRNVSFNRNVATVDPAQAQAQVDQQVRASYPGASSVVVPAPSLLYMPDEAGAAQPALEPELNFAGVQVTLDGETFTLKDINVPAVESGAGGFGPSVSITSPASGSTFKPGSNVALSGAILTGAKPYSYTWELEDGTVLKAGVLAEDGPVALTTNQLPVVSHNGTPSATSVILRATDQDGAVRSAMVSLTPTVAPFLYLPLIDRGGAARDPAPAPAAPAAPQANYSFGIEAGWDYPPYGAGGSDLPGVVPDAYGFRNTLLSIGWSQRFFWANGSAWERDWRDCGLGGGDCTYGVDRADFVYYTGHGSNGGISLPSNIDSSWFPGTNARFSSLRWVGFSSCLTLRVQGYAPPTEPIRGWFNAFRGAHMLLGFNSLMADIAFGGPLADNMRMPTFFGIPLPWAQRTIREAWTLTAFTMHAGKPAYIYAVGTNGVNPVNNKLPQANDPLLPRPYPVASYHWVWWDE